MKKIAPTIVLFSLSPFIGEVLLGSAPPAEFFTFFGLTVLTILYGGGAILARELTLRWHKGWVSLLILGAAYGIIEEGLMVKSFFDPNWMDIGILGSYGRWAGINWVWTLQLTIYHSIVSIAIPIQLTELIFNNHKDKAWIGRKGLIILSIFFAADVAFGYFALTSYRPAANIYWLTAAFVVTLILLAWRLPRQIFLPRTTALPKPFRFWIIGFLGTVMFFFAFWALPHTEIPPAITLLSVTGLMVVITWRIFRMSGNASVWTDRHRLALIAGPLSVFILLSPIQEFDTSRIDNTSGMTLVGIAMSIFLLWLWWRVNKYPPRVGEITD